MNQTPTISCIASAMESHLSDCPLTLSPCPSIGFPLDTGYNSIMNKSKFRRSLVKFNQNNSEVSQHLSFLPLLTLPSGQPRIHPEGLSVIQEQSSGRTYLIAVISRSSGLINALYRNNNLLQDQPKESGVWVANYARYDYQRQRQFIFMHVFGKKEEDLPILHAFCSVVASAVVFEGGQGFPLGFLTSLPSRVVFNGQERNETVNYSERRKEVANLVIVRQSKMKEPPGELRRSQKELQDLLAQAGLQKVLELHKQAVLIRLSVDALEGQSQSYLNKLQEELQDVASSNSKNQDLRNGPVLREYVELVGQALARTGSVDISATTASIRISEGYHAYLKAEETYHSSLRRDLKEEGVPNIKEVLKQAREDALEQFKKESNDAGYLLRITEHIEQTEEKLVEQNNKVLDLRNLAFLKQASQSLLSKLSKERVSEQAARRQIQAIVNDYKLQAAGGNRYEILTNYINILHAAVSKNIAASENSSLKKELDSTRRERDELEERLEQLRRENSKKCCEIM